MAVGSDIFISYARADAQRVELLWERLTEPGKDRPVGLRSSLANGNESAGCARRRG